MRKKIIYTLMFLVLVILIGVMYKYYLLKENKLSDKIIDYIDKNIDDNNTCLLSMEDITDFEWDKMLLYQVGSSNVEISELLGVEFRDSVDLTSGIIFVYKNKIVYKERIFYHPDHPFKLFLNVGEQYEQPQYVINNPESAIFQGSKYLYEGKYYYEIDPSYKE